MSREKSASREGNRMSCLSCRVIMRPNQYFGNTLPFLSITSWSKSPWEKGISCFPARDTKSHKEQDFNEVQVWSCAGLCMTGIPSRPTRYKGSDRTDRGSYRKALATPRSNWIRRSYTRARGSAVETLSLMPLWKSDIKSTLKVILH